MYGYSLKGIISRYCQSTEKGELSSFWREKGLMYQSQCGGCRLAELHWTYLDFYEKERIKLNKLKGKE